MHSRTEAQVPETHLNNLLGGHLWPEGEARPGADALRVDVLIDINALLLQFSQLITQRSGKVETESLGSRLHDLVRLRKHSKNRRDHYESAFFTRDGSFDEPTDQQAHENADLINVDVKLTFDLLDVLAVKGTLRIDACRENYQGQVFNFVDLVNQLPVVGQVWAFTICFNSLNFDILWVVVGSQCRRYLCKFIPKQANVEALPHHFFGILEASRLVRTRDQRSSFAISIVHGELVCLPQAPEPIVSDEEFQEPF